MELRELGRTGLRVSVVGLGGNTFGPPRLNEAESRIVIDAAIDAGINFVDTANRYGEGLSEQFIGRALRGRRDRMVVATKFHLAKLEGVPVATRVKSHLDASLASLETDFIDLYQIHAPVAEQDEAELVDVLADLTRSGKIRAFGCCNYASWRIAEANALAKATDSPGYATVQNYFNMLARQLEAEVAPYCVRASMSVLPYHPLGGGFLTGKYRRGEPPPPGTRGAAGSPIVKKLELGDNWERISRLEQFANDRGRQMSELAIAWLISKSYVGSVIAGASNASQVEANASAATWRLDDAELTLLEGILEEVPSVESPPSAGPR